LPPEPPSVIAELAERVRLGDGSAEEELVSSFYERVYFMALGRTRDREAARDLAQETILTVLRALHAGRLLDPERLAGYICGTARNLIRDHLRSSRPRTEPVEDWPSPAPSPEQDAERSEQQFLVRRALRELSAPDRLVLLLTLVDGLSPAEIASRLGLRPEAVRQRKARAIQRARALLNGVSRTPASGHFFATGS
jgi:RNA polymerase sigma factor (sigma-70 family)